MAAQGTIVRAFGSEERAFVLLVSGWREVEKACGCGLGVIAGRIAPLIQILGFPGGAAAYPGGILAAAAGGLMGSFKVDDLREVLKQGLIGGGLSSTEAGALVRAVFDEEVARGHGPALRWAPLAFDLIMGALVGMEDEPIVAPGEPKAAKRKPSRRSRTAKPASETSTPAAP